MCTYFIGIAALQGSKGLEYDHVRIPLQWIPFYVMLEAIRYFQSSE